MKKKPQVTNQLNLLSLIKGKKEIVEVKPNSKAKRKNNSKTNEQPIKTKINENKEKIKIYNNENTKSEIIIKKTIEIEHIEIEKKEEVDSRFLPWVDKYKPINSNQIIGNAFNIQTMKTFFKEYGKSNVKYLILTGGPGLGKSTSANIISKELDYYPKEINGSLKELNTGLGEGKDEFSSIKFIIDIVTCERNINERKFLLFEEFDGFNLKFNLFKRIIQLAHIPIIFISNSDGSDINIRNIINHSKNEKTGKHLKFDTPTLCEITDYLENICKNEKLNVKPHELEKIIKVSNYDVRNTINSLQFGLKRKTTYNKLCEIFNDCLNYKVKNKLIYYSNQEKENDGEFFKYFINYLKKKNKNYIVHDCDELNEEDIYEMFQIQDADKETIHIINDMDKVNINNFNNFAYKFDEKIKKLNPNNNFFLFINETNNSKYFNYLQKQKIADVYQINEDEEELGKDTVSSMFDDYNNILNDRSNQNKIQNVQKYCDQYGSKFVSDLIFNNNYKYQYKDNDYWEMSDLLSVQDSINSIYDYQNCGEKYIYNYECFDIIKKNNQKENKFVDASIKAINPAKNYNINQQNALIKKEIEYFDWNQNSYESFMLTYYYILDKLKTFVNINDEEEREIFKKENKSIVENTNSEDMVLMPFLIFNLCEKVILEFEIEKRDSIITKIKKILEGKGITWSCIESQFPNGNYRNELIKNIQENFFVFKENDNFSQNIGIIKNICFEAVRVEETSNRDKIVKKIGKMLDNIGIQWKNIAEVFPNDNFENRLLNLYWKKNIQFSLFYESKIIKKKFFNK